MPIRIGQLIRLARPDNWIKNLVVLMPVVFGMRYGHFQAWGQALVAAAAFCLAASAAYILNDIRDREQDRLHPKKKDRPLACGAVSPNTAAGELVVLVVAAMLLAASLSRTMLLVTLGYIVLQVLYTLVLKHRVLVDVIVIAFGFVLRAMAGAVAIRVEISPWLFICMFTVCLFMGFCKRCNEIATLAETGQATQHRVSLGAYTSELLTHLITLSAGVAIVAFLMYAMSDSTIERIGTNYLIYTLPLVVYGVARFAMLSMRGRYADPTDLILHDRAFQANMVLWAATTFSIIVWGRHWHGYLTQWMNS